MVFKSIRFLLIVALTAFTLHAHAIIMDQGNYTTDTDSRLDWLDVTLTRAESYNTVNERISTSGDLYGWRFATGDEVVTLLYNWGLLTGPASTTSNGAPMWQETEINNQLTHVVIKTLGDTKQAAHDDFSTSPPATTELDGQAIFTTGWIADVALIGTANEQHNNFMIHDGDFTWTSSNEDVTSPDWVEMYSATFPFPVDDSGNVDIGSFLVRLSVVPVPASVWLFSSGLIGIIGIARRKKAYETV